MTSDYDTSKLDQLSDRPVILLHPEGGYMVSQPLSGDGLLFEEQATHYPGVFMLRTAPERLVAVLLPGALEHAELITAVKQKLLRDLETPVVEWDDIEPGVLVQLTLHALGDLLAVPGG